MIVTFDDTKNMSSETLRVFKDRSEIPKCEHCGGRLGYNQSISYISCNTAVINNQGQSCSSRHGSTYKEVFEMDNQEEIQEIIDFSKYCQSLKPFIKQHSWYKLNATMPIKFARSIKYNRGNDAKIESLVTFCEKFHIEEYPHLGKEVAVTLYNPTLTRAEVIERMYDLTNDDIYLSEEAQEMFIF